MVIEVSLLEDQEIIFHSFNETGSSTQVEIQVFEAPFGGDIFVIDADGSSRAQLQAGTTRRVGTPDSVIDHFQLIFRPDVNFVGDPGVLRVQIASVTLINPSTTTFSFTVQSVNDAPTNISLSKSSVVENAAGAGVGALLASDPDIGDFHQFSIVGDVSGKFEIRNNTLFLRDGESLDFEEAQSHVVRIRAIDSTNLAFERNLTITVVDVANEDSAATNGAGSETGGADVLIGDGEANVLNGLAGADFFVGSAGADQIDGGADEDTVSYGQFLGGVTVNLGAASNQAFGPEMGFDQLSNIESVIGTQGDDDITGSDADNTLHGEAGDDTLIGGVGNDRLLGSAGDDLLIGNQSHDVLDGGDGNDRLIADALDISINGGDGFDYLSFLGSLGAVLDVALAEVERVAGNRGDDVFDAADADFAVDLDGNDGADILLGGSAMDVLQGGNGDDSIAGGASNDRIYGQGGADNLDGGRGNDRIIGGFGDDIVNGGIRGNDRLTGGAGADIFEFGERWGRDRIEGGFEFGSDIIRFDGVRLGSGQEIGFADLSIISAGADAVISVNGIGVHSITVLGVEASAFQQSSFEFV